MTTSEKIIERANKGCQYFAKLYKVESSKVVWCGNDKYIICKDNKEIRIGFD